MIAILSNINLDSVWKKVNKQIPCVPSVGYGNIIETMINPISKLNQSVVDAVFIIMDLREFVACCQNQNMENRLQEFFFSLLQTMKPQTHYFISDAEYYAPFELDYHMASKSDLCRMQWNTMLQKLLKDRSNVSVFPYHQLVRRMGEDNFYSVKTWYLGSIRYTMEGTKSMVREIMHIVSCMHTSAKKVLVLDLDNTLWGGVVGEDGPNGIELGESHIGKAYMDFQQCIGDMSHAGVVLAINSKNNEEDVWRVFAENPNMYLKKKDFSICMINWNLKSENILKIAQQLNVGLESLVFIDDNPIEREQIKSALPMVECPEFPSRPEDLLQFGINVYEEYFKKIIITNEDRAKVGQYAAKKEIEEFRTHSQNFNSFLEGLQIVLKRQNPMQNKDRLLQLLQKTNQFNVTLKRYSEQEIATMLQSKKWQFYFYEVSDRFTNHGLCALALVKLEDGIARIDNLVMSCRVIGRNIEYGVLEDIERHLGEIGLEVIYADFVKGPKNMPVEDLYDNAGYQCESETETGKNYRLKLQENKKSRFIGRLIY